MAILIGKGDRIFIRAEQFSIAPINVEWSQNTLKRNANYIPCKYESTSGVAKGELFIQESKMKDFRKKGIAGLDDITVIVDNDFQYGQNNQETIRFLVFHDKANKPYQHRFTESLLKILGEKGSEMTLQLGYPSVGSIKNVMTGIFGDKLREF